MGVFFSSFLFSFWLSNLFGPLFPFPFSSLYLFPPVLSSSFSLLCQLLFTFWAIMMIGIRDLMKRKGLGGFFFTFTLLVFVSIRSGEVSLSSSFFLGSGCIIFSSYNHLVLVYTLEEGAGGRGLLVGGRRGPGGPR